MNRILEMKRNLEHEPGIQEYKFKLRSREIKIRLKYIPGYSVLLPATNSPSASDKSNGALFVSATIIIIKINSSEYIP